MAVDDARPSPEELSPRSPSAEDLRDLCRALNLAQARYVVIGGFAIRAAGYDRQTMDVDLLVDASVENVRRVYEALATLPDKAVLQLQPDEVARYSVVRVADEIVVDLMHTACGIEYSEAARETIEREIDGVRIPFASPRLLWRMKAPTRREKDAPDLLFLREYFRARGEQPPELHS